MRTALLLLAFCLAEASIYPPGETPQEWEARIDANIDKHRKSDFTVRIPRNSLANQGKGFKLQINQTQQSIPLGKTLYDVPQWQKKTDSDHNFAPLNTPGTALAARLVAPCFDSNVDTSYCSFARDNFNYAVHENALKWTYWEPSEDNIQSYEVRT